MAWSRASSNIFTKTRLRLNENGTEVITAGITDKVLPHLEAMEPGEILHSARNVERIDYVARRNYGLENQPPGGGPLNIAILTNQAAVQVVPKPA